VVLYYNIDAIMQNLYLPYINPQSITNTETLSSNPELYFLLKITSYFMLTLYLYTFSHKLFISKINNKNCYGLSFVYIKHMVDILIAPNMSLIEYELSRGVMWVFTTPLMLNLYCNVNGISLWDINIHYHILSIVPHIFIIPFKRERIYLISTFVLSVPSVLFLNSLQKYNKMPFTNMYILIWLTFILINALDVTQLCSPIVIHAFYNIADTLCKFICNVVISNYNEQDIIMRENMDLQSVKFVSHVIKSINNFENNNNNKTQVCRDMIKYCKKKFVDKIPKTNSRLKLELLSKILPFDLDKDYVNVTDTGTKRELTFICVMFMDIMNYTELASRYKNGDIIIKLLDDVYNHFDNLINKYSHLQKIETIGDAYMVVGDMYRQDLNHKIVIKEIILLGLEFIKEIKTIKTPDKNPLCIRIGINIGNVSIGILGNEIPRLCVVGNTVNVASRLQSTADADTIQMSRHVYEHADETEFEMNIEFVPKENVFLKNIGSVITYNITPNKKN